MQIIKYFKQLIELQLKAPAFILDVFKNLQRNQDLEIDEDFMGVHSKYLYKPPKDYHRYHHKDCGTKYRGCHPTLCPKDRYERTGVWKV